MAWLILWTAQSLIVAAVAAIVVRLGARRLRPAVQHAVLQSALVAIALLAVANLMPDRVAPASAAPGIPVSSVPEPSLAPLVVPQLSGWFGQAFVWMWAAGALWLAARLLWQVGRVRRLKRACVVMAGGDLRGHALLSRAVREGRRSRFCWCDEIDGPVMLGFGQAAIAVPRAQAESLDRVEFEQVLLHELAHVRRRDDWTALGERLLAAVLWVSPVVWWLNRSLSVTREMACDDWVIRRTAAPVAYARCLTNVAALHRHHAGDRLVAAVVGSRRVLRYRVRRALDDRARPGARVSRAAFALAPMLSGLVGAAVLALPPFVVDGTGSVSPVRETLRLADAAAVRHETVQRREAATIAGDLTLRSAGVARRAATDPPATSRNQAPSPLDPAPGPVAAGASAASAEPPEPAQAPSTVVADDERLLPASGRDAGGLLMASIRGGSEPPSVPPSDQPPWWSKASGAAGALGDGVVTAGRSTASFFKRVGGAFADPFSP